MDEGRNAATRALRTGRRRNGQDDEGCEESFHHTMEYGCHISPDRVSEPRTKAAECGTGSICDSIAWTVGNTGMLIKVDLAEIFVGS